MFEAKIIGEAALGQKIKALENMKDAVERVLFSNALVIMYTSKEHAPVKEGHLQGSITVNRIDEPGVLGYDIGTNVPYAYEQEVHDEYRHPISGQSRYFESTMHERFPIFQQELNDVLRQF